MVRIVADTTCSLPQDVIDSCNITLIASHITIDGETFRDRFDMPASAFYERLRTSKQLPETLQPSVEEFKALYGRLRTEDPDAAIISIHVSGALSGTVAAAQIAAQAFSGADIRVVDTRSLAMGHGLMVQQAARTAMETRDPEAVMARIHDVRQGLKGYVMLDTLEYLAKSGRIGRASLLIGGLLNVKPILTLSQGSVEPYHRSRSRPEALDKLCQLALEAARSADSCKIAVMHTACADDAEMLAGRLRKEAEPDTLLLGEISGAVGAFFGPGALGFAYAVV